MDLFKVLEERRSIKKFVVGHEFTESEIEQLMSATLLSPTAFNIQNWRFVVVTDGEQKQKIFEIGYHQEQFIHCSAVVMICGDRNAYCQDTERYWANAPAQTRQMLVGMIKQYYDAQPEARRDENLRSGGMAAQSLMLAAKAMGYDSCPMSGFDFAAAASIINLPAEHDIVMAVTIGKALAPAQSRGGQLPLGEVVRRNSF